MPRALQIAIVGYGIGGIAAAIQLRRLGHRITHFERNDPPNAPGGGMLLHPRAQRQLAALGVLEAAMACGAPVRRICAQTVHGQPLLDLGYADPIGDRHGLGIQRAALHRVLSDADTGRNLVLGGHHISAVDPKAGYVFRDPDRRHGRYDLIVVADGANSGLREQMPIVARRNRRTDMVALVGLLDDPDRFATERLVQYFDGARHLSVWPAGSEVPGGPLRCAVAMNVSLEEADALRERGRSRDHMTRLCPEIGKLLRGQSDNADLHVFRYRDVELSTYSAGRAVLIGDAAHSMSPQLGVGAQLAMEDAAVLADKLAEHSDLSAALRAYALTRPIQLSRYHQASRWLTPLFQSDSGLLAGIRDRFLGSAIHGAFAKRLARELFC